MRRLFTEPALVAAVCALVHEHVEFNSGFPALFNFYTTTMLSYIAFIDDVPAHIATKIVSIVHEALDSHNKACTFFFQSASVYYKLYVFC